MQAHAQIEAIPRGRRCGNVIARCLDLVTGDLGLPASWDLAAHTWLANPSHRPRGANEMPRDLIQKIATHICLVNTIWLVKLAASIHSRDQDFTVEKERKMSETEAKKSKEGFDVGGFLYVLPAAF